MCQIFIVYLHAWHLSIMAFKLYTLLFFFSLSRIYLFYHLNFQLFETELKQSANKVQELKDKVTELLEKNPDSPEAPKWRQMLDKIGT